MKLRTLEAEKIFVCLLNKQFLPLWVGKGALFPVSQVNNHLSVSLCKLHGQLNKLFGHFVHSNSEALNFDFHFFSLDMRIMQLARQKSLKPELNLKQARHGKRISVEPQTLG